VAAKAGGVAVRAAPGVRYVVVDVETSGLDTRADRMIAIGAVGVERGQLRVGDTFAAVLRQCRASDADNILIHQIGGEAQLSGAEPSKALLGILDFAGKAPLVAFRAEFDRAMLERACKEELGFRPAVPRIDLACLLPALFQTTQVLTSSLALPSQVNLLASNLAAAASPKSGSNGAPRLIVPMTVPSVGAAL